MTSTTARKYLEKVLTKWKKFCKTHSKLAKAIEAILAENERLREENDYILSLLQIDEV